MNRLIPFSIVGIISVSPAFCENPYGQKTFKQLADIKAWLNSTWGGGRLQTIKYGSFEIALAQKSHTSGVKSSGLFVFIKRYEGWVEALRLGPYWMADLKFEQEGDSVTVKHSETQTIILTFSIQSLFSQFDHKSVYSSAGA